MENINSLSGGLHTDSDPSLQPQNTYRKGRNGTLVSKADNHYSFEAIDGTVLNWSMPFHTAGGTKFVPIGWFRMGDKLVVHSTDEKGAVGGDGEIGIVSFDNSGFGTYSALYYHADLDYTQMHQISGYGLEENEIYHRAYWTDNFNQPRTINVILDTLTTNIASGSLVNGTTYMVLTDSIGSITYNALTYGPKQSLGNIFTANVTTTYTANGNVRVIEYFDVRLLNYTPEKMIGTIDFVEYEFGGQVYCGTKMYAYRLTTNDGYQSSWSYLTNPIHVTPSNPSSGYQNYQGDGSTTALVSSGKYITLSITDIPTYFDNIEVAVVECDQKVDIVRNVEIFWQSSITGATMTIYHYGQENLGVVTIDDLALRNAVVLKCKDMTTLKQRQIIANLTEREELDWNPAAATVTPHVYTLPVDERGLTVGDMAFRTYLNPESGVVSGNILPGGHYVVRTANVTYNATVYAPGDTFIGVDNAPTFTTVSGIVKACIRIKKYTTFAGVPQYEIIELNDEYFDYKSMASHRYLAGYYRDETYRIGVLAWDKFGNPFAVKWIEDVTIPSQSDVTGTYKLMNEAPINVDYSLNAVGLTIDNLDITSIRNDIAGISVVRVARDKTVLGQAIMLQNVFSAVDPTTTIVPISAPVPAYCQGWTSVNPDRSAEFTWNLLGPEFDFSIPNTNITLASGDYIKPVSDLSPLLIIGVPWERLSLDQAVYCKYYTHNRYLGNNGNLSYINSLDVSETVTAYMNGLDFKNHDILTNANCAPGFSGAPDSLDEKGANGAQRTLIIADVADFINSLNGAAPGTGTGTQTADGGTDRKLLVNYVRPKGSGALYGGTSDAAKAQNRYQFCNHYLKIDSTVLANIVDGSGNYILNGIEVYGGDCYVNLYDRVSSMFDEHYNSFSTGAATGTGSYSWALIFPVESTINVALREGNHAANVGLYDSSAGIEYDNAGNRRDETFRFNEAYLTQNNQIKYDVLPIGFRSVGRFPYMARYSELKFLGERFDNMRVFKIDHFKNADALHGEINNVRVSFDRLFYWQNKGFGYFPLNERETISSALGGAVQLGVGGVMERYDTLGKYFGNQHQHGLVETSDGWVWFDMRRRSFLTASYNGETADIGVVKGLQDFFINSFNVAEDAGTGNIFGLDKPLLGTGICGVYDDKGIVFLTFKFYSTESRASLDFQRIQDFTVLYSTELKRFIGTTDNVPGIYIEHNGRVYSAKESRFSIIVDMDYAVGMTVSKSGANYVCIQDFTSSNPVAANEEPDFVGSVYWKFVGYENGIHLHEAELGDVCKFHGITYPYELEVVVNPSPNEHKVFDNIELYGNDVMPSDVYYETSSDTAQDNNITTKNKNFEYVNKSWWFSVALQNGKQRLEDHYLRVRVVVKNYVTDPTISLNLKKRIVYLKTIFRQRK